MRIRKTTEQFIIDSIKVHGDKYNYKNVNYITKRIKIQIMCPTHGIFQQTPHDHLKGHGCPKCALCKRISNTENFIEKSKIIHGDKYDYSLVKYFNDKTKVKIVCKKHGVFEQRPNHHLTGRGCSICNESKGENKTLKYLETLNIEYIRQMKFDGCKGIRNRLPFDFYLPNLNICIEYDGEQHFFNKEIWGGEKKLKKTQQNDQIKNQYCLDNNIKLIRIRYDEDVEKVLNESLNIF